MPAPAPSQRGKGNQYRAEDLPGRPMRTCSHRVDSPGYAGRRTAGASFSLSLSLSPFQRAFRWFLSRSRRPLPMRRSASLVLISLVRTRYRLLSRPVTSFPRSPAFAPFTLDSHHGASRTRMSFPPSFPREKERASRHAALRRTAPRARDSRDSRELDLRLAHLFDANVVLLPSRQRLPYRLPSASPPPAGPPVALLPPRENDALRPFRERGSARGRVGKKERFAEAISQLSQRRYVECRCSDSRRSRFALATVRRRSRSAPNTNLFPRPKLGETRREAAS